MGDHRVSIDLKFSMHGHKAETNWWLNWSDHIPEQVKDWVVEQKETAMGKYHKAVGLSDAIKQAEVEQAERSELERLKAKYEARPLARPFWSPRWTG